jgi:hypothetical protein
MKKRAKQKIQPPPREWFRSIEYVRDELAEADKILKEAERFWHAIFTTDEEGEEPRIFIGKNKAGKVVLWHTLYVGCEPAWSFERDFQAMLDEALEVAGYENELDEFADVLLQVQNKCSAMLAARERKGGE